MSWHSPEVEPETETPRKRPRLGIILRLLIYLPLLGFFGWRATRDFIDQRHAADEAFRASIQQWLQHQPRTIMMPNGEEMPVFELTEQEAVEMSLLPEPSSPPLPE